jgi:hypothetical protein
MMQQKMKRNYIKKQSTNYAQVMSSITGGGNVTFGKLVMMLFLQLISTIIMNQI